MKQFYKSLPFLKIYLGFVLSRDFNGCGPFNQIKLYNGIGTCLMNLEQYKESITYFELSLQLLDKHTVVDDDCLSSLTFNLTSILNNVGKCFMKIGQFKKALRVFYDSLKFETECNMEEVHDLLLIGLVEKFVSVARRPQELANVLCNLAICYMKQNSFKKAVSYFQRSFNLLKNLSTAKDIAAIRAELLVCYMEAYQRERVEKHLKDLRKRNSIETTIRMVDAQTFTYSIYI